MGHHLWAPVQGPLDWGNLSYCPLTTSPAAYHNLKPQPPKPLELTFQRQSTILLSLFPKMGERAQSAMRHHSTNRLAKDATMGHKPALLWCSDCQPLTLAGGGPWSAHDPLHRRGVAGPSGPSSPRGINRRATQVRLRGEDVDSWFFLFCFYTPELLDYTSRTMIKAPSRAPC